MNKAIGTVPGITTGTLLVVTTGLGWGQALAQQAQAAAAYAQLQEIVVTATRRPELAQNVPASLTVLPGSQLNHLGINNINGIASLVPGLQLGQATPGFTVEVLRGIDTGITSPGPTVATYMDDTPTTAVSLASGGYAVTPDPDLFDVQRIEVLKGPQGTLFGESSMGGLIRYVFNQPNLNRFEGKAQVGFEGIPGHGTGDSQHLAVNLPLIRGKLAARVVGFRVENPAFIDNVYRNQRDVNSSRSEGGRVSILWWPTDQFSAQLSSYYQRLTDANQPTMDVQPLTLQPISGDLATAEKLPESLYSKLFVNNLRLSYDLPWANLLSSTSVEKSFSRFTDDGSNEVGAIYGPLVGGNATLVSYVTDTKKTTEEMRLTSPSGGRVEWLAGYFYTDENAVLPEADDQYNAVGASDTLVFPNLISVQLDSLLRENALYGNLTYHFSPAFDLQGGVRYSHLDQEYGQSAELFAGSPLVAPLRASAAMSKTTYLGTARYHFSRNAMLYARVATGYRPGGPNVLLPNSTAPSSFGPDSLISYELGLKGTLASHVFDYSADVYRVDWKDIQVVGVDLTSGLGFYGNGGKAHSQGIELAFGYRPIPSLRMSLSGSFDDAKLDESIPIPGVTASKGDELPYAPKIAVSGTLDYRHAISAQTTGFAGLTVAEVGARRAYFAGQLVGIPAFGTTFASPVGELPSYTTLDLRGGFIWRSMTLTAYVRNVTDARGALASYGVLTGVDLAHGTVGPMPLTVMQPRTLGITIGYDF